MSHCSSLHAQRSLEFYQSVFAMPIQTHQGPATLLAVGAKGSFLAIFGGAGGRAGATTPAASINHISFRMRNFNPEKVTKALVSYGLKPRELDASRPLVPLSTYVSMRMPDRGGAPEGTPELYFTDPDGILLQIQDISYCGGAGKLGNVCVP
jgi:catechol 2,3-dioxygenase-like lactoylglutathione lyase family enzyme